MRSSAAAGRGASPPLQGSSSASPAPAGRGRGAGGSPGPPAAFAAPRRPAESPWHFVAPVELRRENIVQYVGETRLDDGLRVAVQRLCSEEELPENPYMYLARQLRVLEPRDESWDRENEAILEELSNRVAVSDPVTTISHAEGDASFWGLPNVVRFVDLKRAPRLKDTLLKFVSKPAGTYDEYQVRVLPSLGGDYAFYGRLVPHPAELLLREAHVVEGPKLEAALNLFALNVLADAFALDEALHSVIGFVIEDEARGEGAARRWAMADMRERKAAFMGELKVAAVARRRLTAEVLAHLSAEEWETGAEPAMYVRLLKQYTFHFAASEERPAVLQASNYGPAPLEAVLDGVFLEKEDADAYVALHFDEDRRFTLGPSSRAFRAEMLARLFAAVRLNDQLSVARVALRLALMDGHFELVPSLHRMLASPAAALAATSATNATLQRLLAARGPPSKMEEMGRTLGAMYVSYAQRLSDVAASNSSSDVIALRPALAATLESLSGAAGAAGRPASLLLNEQTAPRLRRLRAMCEAVALTMAEDLAAGCLDVREYTRQCEVELQKLQVKLRQPPPAPTVVPMVVLVGEEVRALEGRRTVPRDQSREYVLATFLSDMLVDVRLTHILFNLLCDTLVPNPYPVLVRHLKAAGLRSQLRKGDDEAILSLARGQLALADAPRFIYSARSAAAPGSAAAIAAGPGQQAAGAQCFGLASALAFADPLLLAALRVGLRALFLAAPPPLQGYECTVRGALAGHAVVMGRLVRMEPGLPLGLLERVDVVEELRVTGPSVELALHLAASTIASHTERVALSSPHVVEALEAHGAARFGAREVVQQRDAVVGSLSQALRLGQRVSLRGVALVGETYLPFEQFFHVHYINPSNAAVHPYGDVAYPPVFFRAYFTAEDARAAVELSPHLPGKGDPLASESARELRGALKAEAGAASAKGLYRAAYDALVQLLAMDEGRDGAPLLAAARFLRSPAGVVAHLRSQTQVALTIASRPPASGAVHEGAWRQLTEGMAVRASRFLQDPANVFFTGMQRLALDWALSLQRLDVSESRERREGALQAAEDLETFLYVTEMCVGDLVHDGHPAADALFRAFRAAAGPALHHVPSAHP